MRRIEGLRRAFRLPWSTRTRVEQEVDEELRFHLDMAAQELIAAGAPLDAIAYCPHGPDSSCDCRKPRTGMARQIEQRLGEAIDYRQSWTIGDKLADMEFGWSLQTRVALIHSHYWDPRRLERIPDLCVTSLYEAARRITGAT